MYIDVLFALSTESKRWDWAPNSRGLQLGKCSLSHGHLLKEITKALCSESTSVSMYSWQNSVNISSVLLILKWTWACGISGRKKKDILSLYIVSLCVHSNVQQSFFCSSFPTHCQAKSLPSQAAALSLSTAISVTSETEKKKGFFFSTQTGPQHKAKKGGERETTAENKRRKE